MQSKAPLRAGATDSRSGSARLQFTSAAAAKKKAEQPKNRISTSKPKKGSIYAVARTRSPQVLDPKPDIKPQMDVEDVYQQKSNLDLDYKMPDSARDRFERGLPQDPNQVYRILQQERNVRPSHRDQLDAYASDAFKEAGSPIEKSSNAGLNDSLMSVIGDQLKGNYRPQTGLSVEVVKRPTSKEVRSSGKGSIKPYLSRKVKPKQPDTKPKMNTSITLDSNDARQSQYDSFLDRKQPLFPQNNKGPQGNLRDARSPNIPSMDYTPMPNSSLNISSIYESGAPVSRRSKHDRTKSQQSVKLVIPKEEVKLGEKNQGLSQLREDLVTDLILSNGALDVETKAKVDILENEKQRLDAQIEKLKQNKLVSQTKEKLQNDRQLSFAGEVVTFPRRGSSATPDLGLSQRSFAARNVNQMNQQSELESAAIVEKARRAEQLAHIPQPTQRQSSEFDPNSSILSRASVSADPLNKTGRPSLLRFKLRSKVEFDDENQKRVDEIHRSQSPGTRSSRSPPRARNQQPIMLAPPESNRKIQQSVISSVTRIDQLSQPAANHRKIIELEAKLKVLQQNEEKQQRLQAKREIDDELKLLQAQSNNLERSSRVNQAKMIQNTLNQRAAEKAKRDKTDHNERMKESHKIVYDKRQFNRTQSKYHSMQRSVQLHVNRENDVIQKRERADKIKVEKHHKQMLNRQEEEARLRKLYQEKDKVAAEKQAVLDRAAELEALVNDKLTQTGRSEIQSMMDTTQRLTHFKALPIGPIEEEPLSLTQRHSTRKSGQDWSRRNAPLGNIVLSKEPDSEQQTAEFSKRQVARPESARPGLNSGRKSSQPSIKKNNLRSANKFNRDSMKHIMSPEQQPNSDVVPTVSPMHAVQAAFTLPPNNDITVLKHRYSATGAIDLEEETVKNRSPESNKMTRLSRRSSSAVMDAAIGRSSNYVQNLEPVRQSRELLRSNSRAEEQPSKSSAMDSPKPALANEMAQEDTQLNTSGISPYVPTSATKKTKIDINDLKKNKKSLTNADIERLNVGGLIGDKRNRSSSKSPSDVKTGRSSRRARGESKLEKLKSKYGQKRDSSMSIREGSLPRLKDGYADPVLLQRKPAKKIVTTTGQNPTMKSQWSTTGGKMPENINQNAQTPEKKREEDVISEEINKTPHEDLLANSMPPSQQRNRQTLGSMEEKFGTEAGDQNQTNPLGDTINDAANTVFEPEQTEVSQKQEDEHKRMTVNSDTDGELATEPGNEGLPPSVYNVVGAQVNPETIVPKAQLNIQLKDNYADQQEEAEPLDDASSVNTSQKSSKMLNLLRKTKQRSEKHSSVERDNAGSRSDRSRAYVPQMNTEKELPSTQDKLVVRDLSELKQKVNDDKFADQLDKYIDTDNKLSFMTKSSGSRQQQMPQQASEILAKAKQLVASHNQEVHSMQEPDEKYMDVDLKVMVAPEKSTSQAGSTPKRKLPIEVEEEAKLTDNEPSQTEGPTTKRSEPVVKSSGQSQDASQTGRTIGETPKFQKEQSSIKSSVNDGLSHRKQSAASKVTNLINQNQRIGTRVADLPSLRSGTSKKSQVSGKGIAKFTSPKRPTTTVKSNPILSVSVTKPSSSKLIKTTKK